MVTWYIATFEGKRIFRRFDDALWMHGYLKRKGIKAILGGYASENR